MGGIISFNVNHNVSDDVLALLVLVVTFAVLVEEPVNIEGCTSDIEACPSRCVQTLGLCMKLIFLPDPVRSAIMRGDFSMA